MKTQTKKKSIESMMDTEVNSATSTTKELSKMITSYLDERNIEINCWVVHTNDNETEPHEIETYLTHLLFGHLKKICVNTDYEYSAFVRRKYLFVNSFDDFIWLFTEAEKKFFKKQAR